MSSLLIVGVPRSGTTWTGRVLGRTDGAAYVNEPDGFRDPFAFRVMLDHGENPVLAPGDPAPDYERLWTGAFAGGARARSLRNRFAWWLYERTPLDERRAARATGRASNRLRLAARCAVPGRAVPGARQVVVKSVMCALSVEWVYERFRPQVLLVERNPLNVLASWHELGYVRNPREIAAAAQQAATRWGVAAPPPDAPHLALQAFQYGVLSSALRDAAASRPDWVLTTHELLCTDPAAQFRVLAERLGLVWGAEAEHFVAESDTEGTPYRTNRKADEQPDRWRERLTDDQVATIRDTLAVFPYELVP